MSASVKRSFGTNLSNKKRDSSVMPGDASAAAAAAKLSQKEKLERWKQQRAAHPQQPPAATPIASTPIAVIPTAMQSDAVLSTQPVPTPVSCKKPLLAMNPNATGEIFYTPSSSPTNFKQRIESSRQSIEPIAFQVDTSAMSEIQRVNGELRDRVTALESGVELTELRARNGDLERLAGELKSLNGELRRANARLREVTPANNPAEQELQLQQQGEHDRLRARVAELEQALAHATSDVEALRTAAREAVVGVPSDLAALEQSLRDSKQLLGRARADARAAQQNAEDARGALQAATEALDAADEEQSAIRREADEAREQLVQYKERSARLVIAESVAAAARATEQQRRATATAVDDAVQRGKRSMAASAAADVARIRAKYVALLSQAQEQQQQQQQAPPSTTAASTDGPTSNKRLADAIAETTSSAVINESAPATKKRVMVNSGTQTVGWSREHDLDCLRFSHDLLVQKMAEMRGQFVQKLQHMNRLHDALEQRRQNEAQEWNEMLSTTVESLKTQMSNGLKESVLRVRQLQSELESEQQLNERLASDMEQLRRRTSSESQLSDAGEDNATGAASPVARAMERLRAQLGSSRARVEELETENELLMEKLVEFESRTATADATPAAVAAEDESAAIEQQVEQVEQIEVNEEANDVERSGVERMAAQVDAMECFPSAELMANITVTRRGRGGGRR